MSQDLRDNSKHSKKLGELIERDFRNSLHPATFEKMLREQFGRFQDGQPTTLDTIITDLSDIVSQSRRHSRGTDEKGNLIADLKIIEAKAMNIIQVIRQYIQ